VKKDENGSGSVKRTENSSTISIFIIFDGNGSGSRGRTTGSGNSSRINGNAKTDKYDRKIDGNEQYAGT
jgi:hypothetical protein